VIAAELTAKRVQLLKEAFPRMTQFTLLLNPNDQQAMHRFIEEAKMRPRRSVWMFSRFK
jgi:hypothetical protein